MPLYSGEKVFHKVLTASWSMGNQTLLKLVQLDCCTSFNFYNKSIYF